MTTTYEIVERHVNMLHQCAEGLDGVLVTSVFHANPSGEQDRPGTVTHHPVGQPEPMVDAIMACQEIVGANIYVGLQVMRNGLKRGARGTEADIIAVLGLVADMDSDTDKAAGELPMEPSYVIETSPGNGQPVWLFDRPLTAQEAKPLAASLRRATGSDAGTGDISHVWRVPGTLNWPNKKKLSRGRDPEPAQVSVAEDWDGSLIPVVEFKRSLAGYSAVTTNERDISVGSLPDVADLTVDKELRKMLDADGQPDRSAHAARVIDRLAFLGHSVEEAIALVLNCNGAWAERYSSSDAARKDVERLWKKYGQEHSDMSRIGAEIAARLLSRPGSVTAAATVTAVTEPPPLVKATPYVWKDSSTLPRREFLYGTHLIRRYVSVTVAPGGLGKSSLTMTEALAMATGRALLGTLPAADLRCWIFNLEDPRDELDRRLAASCKLHNVDAKSLNGRLFLDSGREQNLVVAFDDKRGVKIAVPTVEAVISEIKKNNIDVMIIDPFVSTHSVSENDNGAIDKVTKLWSQIADETNCAIEIVHHVRKVQDREVTVEDARGAVSLLAAARSARVLNRMTEEQAKAAGISDDERFSIFGVQAGKSNLAPLSSKSEWRKLESVPLGNGAGPQRPQDHAPVVVEWKWPEIEDAPAKEEEPGIQPLSFTDEELNLIKIRIKNTECKWDTRAGDWAGWKIAEVMGIEMDDQSKASIAMTIENLISGRILKKTEEKDSHGKVKKFVRVV
jgi:hypothetical protein